MRIFPKINQISLRNALREQILSADRNAYRQTVAALIRYDLRKRLHEIHAETLVIMGEEDTTVSPTLQADLAIGLVNSVYRTIPGAGHGLIAEKPDTANDLIMDFLRE